MMRPRTNTLIAGHPVVAVPTIALCGFVALLQITNEGFGGLTLCMLVMAGWFASCMKEAGRYRAWLREWNALDPDRPPPRTIMGHARGLTKLVVCLAVAGGSFWLFEHFNDTTSAAHSIATALAIGLPLLWIVSRFAGGRKARRTPPHDWIVAQALSRPLPAPSAAEAFARLPDYCRPQPRKDRA